MPREKSLLTPDIIFTLGEILSALTSVNITEDIIRTVCRTTGIAAVGQSDLSSCLKNFRDKFGTPKDKLLVLADIIPEGLLTALLIVAQEYANSRASWVYQANQQANQAIQAKMTNLENERAEARTAASAKEAECTILAKDLESATESVVRLTNDKNTLEKEIAHLRGRLLERNKGKRKKPSPESSASKGKLVSRSGKMEAPLPQNEPS